MNIKKIALACAMATTLTTVNATEIYFNSKYFSAGLGEVVPMSGVLLVGDNGEGLVEHAGLKISFQGDEYETWLDCNGTLSSIRCTTDMYPHVAMGRNDRALSITQVEIDFGKARTASGNIAYLNERYAQSDGVDLGGEFTLEINEQFTDSFRAADDSSHPAHFGSRLVRDSLAWNYLSSLYLPSTLAPVAQHWENYVTNIVGPSGGTISMATDIANPTHRNYSSSTVNADVTISAEDIWSHERFFLTRKMLSLSPNEDSRLLPSNSLTIPGSTPMGRYAIIATVFDKGTGGNSTYIMDYFEKTK